MPAPTKLGRRQLPGVTTESTICGTDLTAWLVQSMQAERFEVNRILQGRHAKLLAEWSQIRSHVDSTFSGGTAPSAPTTPRVKAPITPRADVPKTEMDETVTDHARRANGISVDACAAERDVSDRLQFKKPSPQQETEGEGNCSKCENDGRASDRRSNLSMEDEVIRVNMLSRSMSAMSTDMFVSAMRENGFRSSMQAVVPLKYAGDSYFSLRAVYCLVSSAQFELVFGGLIVLSGLVMALQVQYEGLQVGYEENFPHHNEPVAQRFPGLGKILSIVQFILGISFLSEVIFKMVGLGIEFCRSFWNWFDVCMVCGWFFYEIGIGMVTNPAILRLLRLARLLRMLRLARTFAVFDVLHLLIGSIRASVMVLFWSMIFLFFLMMTAALVMNALLTGYISADDSTKKYIVFKYFGTFTRSMVTMWEVTLGNWVPVGRLLMDDVSEWFGLLVLVWRGMVGFSTITVIRGVFLNETFKAAQTDEQLMSVQKQRMIRKTRGFMMAFLEEADTSGDGFLSLEAFLSLKSDPKMKAWLAAMDLDISDAEMVFSMMDDGDGLLTVDELLDGIGRLRGNAKSLDMCHLNSKVSRIENILREIAKEQGVRPHPNLSKAWTKRYS